MVIQRVQGRATRNDMYVEATTIVLNDNNLRLSGEV